MSAVKGVNVTKVDAGASGDNVIGQGLVNARVEVFTDLYEASALANASTIDVAVLPKGAKVLLVEVYFDALGSGTTLKAGDTDDDDRYIAAAATTSAGVLRSGKVDGKGYVIGTADGDEVIQLTTADIVTGTIRTNVYFTR
jgi:hypothetical protein